MTQNKTSKDEKVEKLASLMHQIWAGWQTWVHQTSKLNNDGSRTIPEELVVRWNRQIVAPYKELSEKEKESDRVEARKVLRLLRKTDHIGDANKMFTLDEIRKLKNMEIENLDYIEKDEDRLHEWIDRSARNSLKKQILLEIKKMEEK